MECGDLRSLCSEWVMAWGLIGLLWTARMLYGPQVPFRGRERVSERRPCANEMLMTRDTPPASPSRRIIAAARGSVSQSVRGIAPLPIENPRKQAARARPQDKASFPGLDAASSDLSCSATFE